MGCYDVVTTGLDPVVHSSVRLSVSEMDCRVEPGNDGIESMFRPFRTHTVFTSEFFVATLAVGVGKVAI